MVEIWREVLGFCHEVILNVISGELRVWLISIPEHEIIRKPTGKIKKSQELKTYSFFGKRRGYEFCEIENL